MLARFSALWWNGKLNLWEEVEELAANVPILERRKGEYTRKKRMERCGKGFSCFSRLFNKLLLCSTILPLENVQSSGGKKGRSKSEEHGQFANQFSIKLLEFSRPRCVFVSENLERENTSRLGFRLEEEEKETRLINWQIVARYSNRPRRNDSLELGRLFFRSLCNCVGQDETPSRLYPARLIETGTTLDSLERRVVFQKPPPWCWNDRWNLANYWILEDRVRWSWQETRRICKENRVLKSTSSADCSFMVRSICWMLYRAVESFWYSKSSWSWRCWDDWEVCT